MASGEAEGSSGSACDRWYSLPIPVRIEVTQLAGQGRPHPDPSVARAACDWARVLLSAAEVDRRDNRNPLLWLFLGVAAAFDFVLGGLGSWSDPSQPSEASERRWARRVLAVHGEEGGGKSGSHVG